VEALMEETAFVIMDCPCDLTAEQWGELGFHGGYGWVCHHLINIEYTPKEIALFPI
jgi:hypothetical protein